MAGYVRVGDIGTPIRVTIEDDEGAVDVSAATTLQLIFRKPSGAILEKTATLVGDGTGGVIQYPLAGGDVDEAGNWRVQAKVVIGTGTWRSTWHEFEVKPNL